MPQTLLPAHSDFEYSDKMGLGAFETWLIQTLGWDPARSQPRRAGRRSISRHKRVRDGAEAHHRAEGN